MIIVTSPSKPFTYNAKGYPRRLAILKEYQQEIQTLYDVVEQSSQSDVSPPYNWNPDGVLEYVQRVVTSVMKHQVANDADLFRHGCDRCVVEYLDAAYWY